MRRNPIRDISLLARQFRTTAKDGQQRSGAVLVMVVLLLTLLLAMVAFTIDVGKMTMLRSEMQNSVDAGTLAAQLRLQMKSGTPKTAKVAAESYIRKNRAGSKLVPEGSIKVELGKWDALTKTFTAGKKDANSVHVFATQTDEPFIFGKVLGHKTFGATASAISTSADSSLDIMLTLDLSGSMLYQGRIQALRQAAPVFVDVIDELGSTDKIGVMGLSADPTSFDQEKVGSTAKLYSSGLHPTAGHHVGVLEQRLTLDFKHLKNSGLSETNLRASKYNGWTGTGAALGDSVHYLVNGAENRSGAKKIVVLMSDGHANRPSGNGPGYAMQMANYAAANNVTVYTISLGNSTDQDLMQDIANTTGGMHFLANGSGAAVLTLALTDAFKEIAGAIKNTHLVK